MIRIDQIRTDGGTQSRAQINDETVSEYAEAMADPNCVFPPAIVYYDGKDYWLADGFHRVAAWSRVGRVEVPTEVRQGTRRDAILHSCAANSEHGLRRTNADKRRAVMTLLNDPEWAQWSDREIARRCAVSPSFVGGMRGASVHDGQIATSRTVERNGTTYQQNTANIGGSKPDQDGTAPAPQENMAETATSPDFSAPQSRADQETKGAVSPDPHRNGLSQLTRDGLEDEIAGLRAENAELRDDLAKAEAERDRLKAANKELSSSDQGATISRIQKQLQAAKYARDEAMSATKREEYKRKKAEKELARIMGQEIEL
ncbi:hypothetical protein [Phaeobacter sp. S60]|uniref:hypothetical protein n=1 Tax=Phaeobacter sp. S60 TaxID=1569353 RepID=UPI0006945919|nr:hypothetical protein [Phaeobacter sp. S60]